MNYRDYITVAAFMVLPFMLISSGLIHEGQHLAFVFLSLMVIASQIRNEWIFAFCCYMVLWIVFVCVYKLVYGLNTMIYVQAVDRFVYFIAAAAIFVGVVRSKLKTELFYNLICIASLIQCAIAISQFYGFDPLVWAINKVISAVHLLDERTMVGTLGNNNFLSAFIAVSLPFFFRKGWRWGIIPVAFVLYHGRTTSAVVPAIVGTLIFFYYRIPWKYVLYASIPCLLAGAWYAVFNHTPFYSNPRWTDWASALSLWSQSSFAVLFGMGPGANWGKGYPMHNEWLECLYQFGVIGFGLMAGYVVTIYRGNRILFTAFFIAFFNMFGNYSLHLAPSGFLIIIVAGLIERERTALKGDVTSCKPVSETGRQAATRPHGVHTT